MTGTDALISLHTALIDAREGYETARRDTKSTDLKALFQSVISLHDDGHAAIHAMLTSRGEKPADDGSFMATVYKAVIATRAALQGLAESSLASFAEGEERIVDEYEKAIEGNAHDPEALAVLTSQRDALLAKITEMKRNAA